MSYKSHCVLIRYLQDAKFAEFAKDLEYSLSTFESHSSSGISVKITDGPYFPKYLASSQLLKLQVLLSLLAEVLIELPSQLQDASFRRQLLTQVIIFLHSLLNPVSSKPAEALKDRQVSLSLSWPSCVLTVLAESTSIRPAEESSHSA
jgi:hypothetical protein